MASNGRGIGSMWPVTADTKGYVYAREERYFVHAPAYRDWVVRAFNEDLPYDDFLLLQLAADQAAPNDPAALAAMGYLTLGRRFLGVTHDIIDDRIDVVARGLLGLTVGCADVTITSSIPFPPTIIIRCTACFRTASRRMVPIAEPTQRDEAYTAFETELEKRQQALAKAMSTAREETSSIARPQDSRISGRAVGARKVPRRKF